MSTSVCVIRKCPHDTLTATGNHWVSLQAEIVLFPCPCWWPCLWHWLCLVPSWNPSLHAHHLAVFHWRLSKLCNILRLHHGQWAGKKGIFGLCLHTAFIVSPVEFVPEDINCAHLGWWSRATTYQWSIQWICSHQLLSLTAVHATDKNVWAVSAPHR